MFVLQLLHHILLQPKSSQQPLDDNSFRDNSSIVLSYSYRTLIRNNSTQNPLNQSSISLIHDQNKTLEKQKSLMIQRIILIHLPLLELFYIIKRKFLTYLLRLQHRLYLTIDYLNLLTYLIQYSCVKLVEMTCLIFYQ